MFPTLKAIAKVVSKADVSACGLKPDQAHVVIIPDPKPGMYGLFLANDILMVDYGSAMSFRTKYCNLGFHKRVKVGRWHAPCLKASAVPTAVNKSCKIIEPGIDNFDAPMLKSGQASTVLVS